MKPLIIAVIFCSSLSEAHSLRMTHFKKAVGRCLKSKSTKCLQKHIAKDLNFPEHTTFGCDTERTNRITPYEFAHCAIRSKVKCTDLKPKITPKTLYEVLSECFFSSKSVGSEDQIVTKSGYVCRLEVIAGELFITSVAIQDHLSGFEETDQQP